MKIWLPFFCSLLLSLNSVCCDPEPCQEPVDNCCEAAPFQGWSIDIGGQYTWMLFTAPDLTRLTGNTGGAHGSITYQKADSLFAQVRSYWNGGHLSGHLRKTNEREFYTDLLAGYCFSLCPSWLITPYLGLGFDFLDEHQSAVGFLPIGLKYRLNYGLAGLDIRYLWGRDWVFGGQVECFPTFEQHLSINGLAGAAWRLQERVGWAARLPIAFRLMNQIWVEVGPYYRYLPIGKSNVLSLAHRNLNEIGALVTFRFFL